jgi:N-glycosylase/DNA lyase
MDTETLRLPDFDVETTLLGGQTFRWEKEVANGATSFFGMIHDQEVQVVIEENNLPAIRLSASGNCKKVLFDYFDLERDYDNARSTLLLDQPMADFISPVFSPTRQPRILRQPWFETLIAFIVSANNNIPRIRNTIKVISRLYGTRITEGTLIEFAFPTPDSLSRARPETLRNECNTGYRDRYILDTAKRVKDEFPFWDGHATRTVEELREALLSLPGVGPKVAECVLLFGFHRWEAFPVDTWVRKAVHEVFPETEGYSDRDIMTFARERFGPLAGFAQQLLFEAARKRASVRNQPGGQPFQAGL